MLNIPRHDSEIHLASSGEYILLSPALGIECSRTQYC